MFVIAYFLALYDGYAGIQRDPTLLIFQGAKNADLTRRVGETLMIGDEVTVTVLG